VLGCSLDAALAQIGNSLLAEHPRSAVGHQTHLVFGQLKTKRRPGYGQLGLCLLCGTRDSLLPIKGNTPIWEFRHTLQRLPSTQFGFRR